MPFSAVPLDAGPGASCFLIELLLGQPTTSTVRTSSDCVLWVVRGPALMALAARRPDLVLELGLKMSQDLAQQVEAMEANMQVGGGLEGCWSPLKRGYLHVVALSVFLGCSRGACGWKVATDTHNLKPAPANRPSCGACSFCVWCCAL